MKTNRQTDGWTDIQDERIKQSCGILNKNFKIIFSVFIFDLNLNVLDFQNVAFQADQRVKSQILSSLGTDQIFRLLSDSEVTVVMKTLGLLRNLLSAPHIDHIMGLYGNQIMQVS